MREESKTLRHSIMLGVATLLVALALPTSAQTSPPPTAAATSPAILAGERAGRALLADAFIDEARRRVHTSYLPQDLAMNEAFTLLQAAQRLTPDNTDMLRRLAAAAIATNNPDIAREAYRQLVKLEPDNLVAQVLFLESLARGKPVEEQLKIYQAALAKADLNAQVRSEMALRVGNLLLQRGQGDEGLKALQQALALNDVNVAAWQEIARYLAARNAPPVDRFEALIGLLMANPYQPDALAAAAHLLGSAGDHDIAVDYLGAAIEQLRLASFQIPANNYLELAMELALADRNSDAQQLLANLINVPDAPLTAPVCALLVRADAATGALPAPATAPAPSATAPSPAATAPASPTTAPALTDDAVLALLRKTAQAAIAADPKSDAALADAIWAELIAAPTPAPETADRLTALKTLVGEGNPVYQRLQGWMLLRSGKVPEAKAILEPLSAKDPIAMIGMVRVWVAEDKMPDAKSHLQELLNAEPVEVLALLIKVEADRNKIVLDPPPLAKPMRDAAAKYPRSLLLAARNPRDLILLTPSLPKRRFSLGEPIILTVTASNQTDRPLAVGPTAPVSTQLAVGGRLRGIDSQDLGTFAFASEPSTYRIERRGTVTQTIRVDQGLLRDYLYANPTHLFSVGLALVTAPHEVAGQFPPGLGGQRVVAGEFDRDGISITSGEQLLKIVRDLPHLPEDRQMLLGAMLESIVYNLPESGAPTDTAPAPGSVNMGDVRKQIIASLLEQLHGGSPVVQAWLLRQAPPRELPPAIITALTDLQDNPDPIVRIVAYSRALTMLRGDPIKLAGLIDALKGVARKEPDPLAARWADLLAQEAAVPPPPPATAPATQPAPPPPN